MNLKKNLIIAAISVLVILVIGLILWFKPAASRLDTSKPVLNNPNALQSLNNNTGHSIAAADQSANPENIPLADSLQGTEIDCALEANSAGQLVLNINIKRCFEYFLTQIGEKSLSVIDQQLRQQIKQSLPATAAQQAIDLWQRYLKYREAESKLKVDGSGNDPEHLQRVLNALTQLRQQFFKPAEVEALFGAEMVYNQYTIDRMNIMEDHKLTSSQKAQQLKERFAQLPADLQQNLQEISKLQDLRTLTKSIKDKNGSAAELRQMREQLVGAAAADRLEQLDQSRANWQGRVDTYLGQRQVILSTSQSEQDKQAAIATLRNQQFATEAERQRAITYEHFKDQGVNTEQALN